MGMPVDIPEAVVELIEKAGAVFSHLLTSGGDSAVNDEVLTLNFSGLRHKAKGQTNITDKAGQSTATGLPLSKQKTGNPNINLNQEKGVRYERSCEQASPGLYRHCRR